MTAYRRAGEVIALLTNVVDSAKTGAEQDQGDLSLVTSSLLQLRS